MPSFLVAQNANKAFTPTYVPIVVITGATSGIGAAMADVLANRLHGRVHIVLVGRNKAAADAIIASLPSTSPDSTYEFVACDLTLMKNVHALAKDLTARLPKINFLVHSAGVFGLRGREDTEEGIDKKIASRFYQRFALTYDLLPLLHKAEQAGEAASVMSVMAAGTGPSKVIMDDLGLKKNYAGWRAMLQSVCYNDLMVAAFAERHPQIAFTHIFPGSVNTGMLDFYNPIARAIMFFFRPLAWLLLTTVDVCGEYMTYALIDAEKGMNRRNSTGDDIGMKAFPDVTPDDINLFWEHSIKETRIDSS